VALANLFVQKAFSEEIKLLGIKVKRLRDAKKLTQQELADLCEVDIRTIQRVEKGSYGMGLHLLFALSKALELTAHALVKMPKKRNI
jgi:transcriptional regulator with XRE-family HTH domain